MTSIVDAARVVLAFLVFLAVAFVRWAAAGHPEQRDRPVTCPPGHDLRTGVQRDGSFRCWPNVVGDPDWDGTWHREERSTQPAGGVDMRVVCTGGALPIVVTERDGRADRTVGCQR